MAHCLVPGLLSASVGNAAVVVGISSSSFLDLASTPVGMNWYNVEIDGMQALAVTSMR